MQYTGIKKGYFIERPNRFIAYVEIDGVIETVHVKNTGRCAELFVPGAVVFVQENPGNKRKTRWDLISVEKEGRIINVDSQAPNKVVEEWLRGGNLFQDITLIRPEYTYGSSRIDLYVEMGSRRALIEVKGVTLEENGVVRFPDAPSERAVKHVEELERAVKEGYEAYIFFVIQMRGVRYFTPNTDTHPQFAEELRKAAADGVKILAYDCDVVTDSLTIADKVRVILENPTLYELSGSVVKWFQENKRDLPWRAVKDPYHIWVSEIMLQQTRVEAVKPYYERFLKELPTVEALAEEPEDRLLKLWEGLGYYNRVRNMRKAAKQIVIDYQGRFPDTFEEIRSLPGIGDYTAGAISSIAYGLPKPAVDGNVLRVITRITGDDGDITKQSTRKRITEKLEQVIPRNAPGDFNQALIELGALICLPNGEPKCRKCPAYKYCEARKQGRVESFPVKSKQKERKIEQRTILVFKDTDKIAIAKRPPKGLLAGLYELPGVSGHLDLEEVKSYCKTIGLMPVHIKKLSHARHIFSHIEWHMIGYEVQVDELEKTNKKDFLFISPKEIQREYPIPSAFEPYMAQL